jgi:hypothetical protein
MGLLLTNPPRRRFGITSAYNEAGVTRQVRRAVIVLDLSTGIPTLIRFWLLLLVNSPHLAAKKSFRITL